MMTTQILTGDAKSAFLKVFTPLSQFNNDIINSKNKCQHDPYVSLRTYCELNLDEIQVSPVIVDNYGSFGFYFKSGASKARNLFCSSLNFTGRTWHTAPDATAHMLQTATCALKTKISDINGCLPDDKVELEALVSEVKLIKTTLKQCRFTVCHVFKTLVDPASEQYEQGTQLNSSAIKTQYDELNSIIGELQELKVKISTKLNPPEVVQEKIPSVPKNLEFKTETDASKWFLFQIAQYRKANWNGDKCFKDTMALGKGSEETPQAFYNFATSLDAAIKDPMLSHEFFAGYYSRCVQKELLPQFECNNFQELLCKLYKDKSERKLYQNVFRALLNESGTGPFGLKDESKIINKIFQSDYFPMFDPEHEVK